MGNNRRLISLLVLAIVSTAICISEVKSKDSYNVSVAKNQTDDQHTQKTSVDAPNALNVTVSGNLNLLPQKDTLEYSQDKSGWLESFLLDIKITDLFLVLFTGFLWWSTRNLWRVTKNLHTAAIGQSEDMKNSITESARAANAMEKVAESMSVNVQAVAESVQTSKGIAERQKIYGQMQLRAYISVLINTGIYQDEKLRFEIKPSVINSGSTPAHKFRYWAKADVFSFPLPENFQFPKGEEPQNGAILGPRQNMVLNAAVDKKFTEEEVDEIRVGRHNRVYIWGTVYYEDAFGEPHYTNFAQSIYWIKTGKDKAGKDEYAIMGNYTYEHNEAT